MSDISPLLATKLVRKRLLNTDCKMDRSTTGGMEVELTYGFQLIPYPPDKRDAFDFCIETTTSLVGKSEKSGKEQLKISFTLSGDYKIIGEGVSIEDLEGKEKEFGQQLFISARDLLAYISSQMGFSSGTLPYYVGFEEEVSQDTAPKKTASKSAGSGKRRASPKKK